jgi:peptide chain release factor 2
MREKKRLEDMLATESDLVRRTGDISAYFDLAKEGENVESDLRREVDDLRAQVEKLETETLLSGENDPRNAIVTIHPGAGGTESQDWAEMLMRMYLRWAERQGFQTVLYDYQPGEEAGIKSATFGVNGEYGFGLLTSEIGRAPAGANFTIRSGEAAAHILRKCFCLSRNRRVHRGCDPAGRHSH